MISKGALAAMAGAGMTGAAGTGAYYMGAFDGLLSDNKGQSTGAIAKTFQSIRKEEKFECLNSILPELHQTIKNSLDSSTAPDGAKEITSENKVEDNFFEQNVTYKLNNCLDVNWDKKLSSDNKWQGNFRYLWSFNHQDQALVIFNSIETSSSSSDPTITGGVYFVKKGGSKGTQWIVDKYKKWSSTITSAEFEDKFPKVGDGIVDKTKFSDSKDYWGFVTGTSDLNNICVASKGCKEDQLTTDKKFRSRWEWEQNSGTHTPLDWVKNSDAWFTKLYPDIPNFKDILNKKFSNMKGKWTNKSLSNT